MRLPLPVLLIALLLPAPAPAATWLAGEMTGAGPHPRGLVTPESLEMLRDRVEREPYSALLARIEGLASREVDLDDHEIGPERRKAETARAAAWLFVLDRRTSAGGLVVPFDDPAERQALGDKSVELLLSMYRESRAGGLASFTLDIHTAQELHLWADTLDLLLGAETDVLGDDRGDAIQGVADLAADLYADFEIENWYTTRALVNNHRSKSASALGLAAIALNGLDWQVPEGLDDGRYEVEDWVDFAVRYVDFVQRDILTDTDGGIMEAGGYLVYAGIEHHPFTWVWSRYTGAAPWVIEPKADRPPYYLTGAAEPYTVPDLWTDPWLERQLLWAVRTMLPDGSFPPFDDCTPSARLYWGAFANDDFARPGLYRWMWELNGRPVSGSVDSSAFVVAALDDSIAPVSPEEAGLSPSAVLPRAGQAVFRSDWSEDAVFALFLAEHGNAAGNSQTRWGEYVDGTAGHEHPDALSFVLHAGGEALLIDSGYLGWDEHGDVNGAENHSLVLVDGAGPPGPRLVLPLIEVDDDGEITLLEPEREGGWSVRLDDDGRPEGMGWMVSSDLETPGVATAALFTTFQGQGPFTEHSRRVTFLLDRFFVLHDALLSREDPPEEHIFTHLLHTHCGGDSDGTLEELDGGVLCTREGARLRAIVLSPEAELEQEVTEAVHDEGSWERRTHGVLETSLTGMAGEEVHFLSLLLPESATGGGYPEALVEVADCPGACASWSMDEVDCEAWDETLRLVFSPGGTALVEAASGAFCNDGELLAGTFAGLPEDPDSLLVASFELDGEGGVTGWEVARLAGDADRQLDLPAVLGTEPDGACAWVEEAGRWRLDAPVPSRVRTAAQARPVVASAILQGLEPGHPATVITGEATTLDASGSCGRSGPLSWSWELEERPELSAVEIPADAAGATLGIVADLPGLYRLRVRVEGADGSDEAVVELEATGEAAPLPEPVEPEPEPETGCGCAARLGDAGGGAAWVVGLVVAARWRRRSSSAPPALRDGDEDGGPSGWGKGDGGTETGV